MEDGLGEGRHSELGVETVSMGRGLGGDSAKSVASGQLASGMKSF